MKVRFDDETVIRPTSEITQANPILVYLETESSKMFDNTCEVNKVSNSTTLAINKNKNNHTHTSRFGRKICKPSKHAKYFMLLSVLITSQFVSFQDEHCELSKHNHLPFFKA